MARIKDFIPPVIVELLILIRLGLAGNKFKHGYSTWEHAAAECSGYDAKAISDQILDSSRSERDGVCAYERDGVVFDEIQHSWELLAALLGTPRRGSSLRILDWGIARFDLQAES